MMHRVDAFWKRQWLKMSAAGPKRGGAGAAVAEPEEEEGLEENIEKEEGKEVADFGFDKDGNLIEEEKQEEVEVDVECNPIEKAEEEETKLHEKLAVEADAKEAHRAEKKADQDAKVAAALAARDTDQPAPTE